MLTRVCGRVGDDHWAAYLLRLSHESWQHTAELSEVWNHARGRDVVDTGQHKITPAD